MIRDYGEPITLNVDGYDVEAPQGEPLTEVLDRLGTGIQHVCYHPALGPIQTCDTCLVEVDGELKRSCALPVSAGLKVDTNTRTGRAARLEAMNRLLFNHNLYCTICDKNNGDCEVHNATRAVQVEHPKYDFTPKPYTLDATNPFYQYDPDQCIACGRCVEACQNVQVNETLSIDWRAERPRVLWDGGANVNDSSCVSCGHCITVCPCNALMEKSMVHHAGHFTKLPPAVRQPAIELVKSVEPYTGLGPIFALSDAEAKMREADIKKTKTVCTYCGVGCSFDVWTKGRAILKVQPQLEAPANSISTCVKGKFGWDYVNAPDRLTTPLIRENGAFREASWDEALSLVARRMSAIKEKDGPETLGFIASCKSTNEHAYLLQKLARGVFKSNNVDNDSRYCQSPATMGLWRTVGYGGDSGTIEDIERASLILIVGSNTAENHPVLATRVKRSQKLHGQRVIVADLRKHEMARRADVFLRPKPSTDLIWIQAVTKYIIDSNLHAKSFVEERVNGFDEYVRSLDGFTLEHAERETGLSADTLRGVAEEIANAETMCVLWGMGVTQHSMGANTSTALSNLLLVTGNYGRSGTGAYPLRGHNNVQGVSDFGALTNYLPGYQKVADDEARARYELVWGVELPTGEGLNNTKMVEEAHAGNLKGLYVVGEELAIVESNANHVEEALERLEFLVVQDLFLTRTAQFADVVLPACPALEQDGTFVNTERRIQRLYQALDPYAEARPDWEILTDLANRLGHEWVYHHPSDVMKEIAATTPLFNGVTYERLEGYGSLLWPMNEDGSDTPLLYTDHFHFDDGKARLYPVEMRAPKEKLGAEYDLHLNNGRILEHFHTTVMTGRVLGLVEKVPSTFIEVSPELAQERGYESGDWVEIASERAHFDVQVLVTDRVRGKELYMPMNSHERAVNRLTSSETDPATDTPAYKETAVKLTKLGDTGPSPLPPTNPRFGRPTPQDGVQVEEKWRRSDYVFPKHARPPGGKV